MNNDERLGRVALEKLEELRQTSPGLSAIEILLYALFDPELEELREGVDP